MVLLDVRTKEEYEGGHIEGAVNHDIIDMMKGSLPLLSKDEEISLYCESGNRSMMAKTLLGRAGFTNVKDLGSINNLK